MPECHFPTAVGNNNFIAIITIVTPRRYLCRQRRGRRHMLLHRPESPSTNLRKGSGLWCRKDPFFRDSFLLYLQNLINIYDRWPNVNRFAAAAAFCFHYRCSLYRESGHGLLCLLWHGIEQLLVRDAV